MLRSTVLAAAAGVATIVLASPDAWASRQQRGCLGQAHGYGPAPAYATRYHGPAGYSSDHGRQWASGAVYRDPSTYVVYEPPYAGYSRPCSYFYAGLGNPRWLSGRGEGR